MNSYGATILPNNIILVPYHSQSAEQIAIDIGGTLAKIVYLAGNRLYFYKFETVHIEQFISFLQSIIQHRETAVETTDQQSGLPLNKPLVIKATGGGAFKYATLLQERLGVAVEKEDEMHCLIAGLNFFITEIPYEVFTYSEHDPMQFEGIPVDSEVYPYILVNIGSGVSILKVTAEDRFERISGTSCGGGTLHGLLSVLTPARSFDEMLELAMQGDNKNVDMLVGDIYGSDYSKIGLKATTIASSFGKVSKMSNESKETSPADMARSLLYLISNTIAQIAYLNARVHGISKIYFGGSYIRGHPITMNTLSYAIQFWSKGEMRALFLRHEGYIGAMGAFLSTYGPAKKRSNSYCKCTFDVVYCLFDTVIIVENFTLAHQNQNKGSPTVGVLDRFPGRLVPFPLLADPQNYDPDIVDLTRTDKSMLNYWLDLLDNNLNSLVDMAVKSRSSSIAAEQQYQQQSEPKKELLEKIDRFKTLFRQHIGALRVEPACYGTLTLRGLLSLREQCLHEVGLPDIFASVKRRENEAAMQALPTLIQKFEKKPTVDGQQIQSLLHGILAGNMFDWGSTPILELVRQNKLDFHTAKRVIGRPPQFNNTDKFCERLMKQPYKKAIIFVDNSGADFVLGILPFARYLLTQDTRVVLAANSEPALNDITADDLENILDQCLSLDEVLGAAWTNGRLSAVGSGSSSPCLDLGRVSEKCAREAHDADLVVLEGMGRAIHTNFRSMFRCDSLKIAVVKNEAIAKLIGCQLYDGICLFHPSDL